MILKAILIPSETKKEDKIKYIFQHYFINKLILYFVLCFYFINREIFINMNIDDMRSNLRDLQSKQRENQKKRYGLILEIKNMPYKSRRNQFPTGGYGSREFERGP